MAQGQTEDGIVFEYADGTDPTQDQGLRQAIAAERARRGGKPIAPAAPPNKWQAGMSQIDNQIAEMGPLKRGLSNVAAGVDNAVMGARQLGAMVGLGDGVSDDEIRFKREWGKKLSKSSDMGIAPDWVPTMGTAAQWAGEALPTIAVPTGAAAIGAGKVAGKVLPKAMMIGRGGAAALDSAIMGGVSGALSPTLSDESRGANVAAGTIGGAVLPGAMAAYRGVQSALGVGQGLTRRVGGKYVKEMGEDGAKQFADDLSGKLAGRSGVTADIPLTAAELTQNPAAAVIERQARTSSSKTVSDWTDFRTQQNKARVSALRQISDDARAGDLPGLKAERDALTGPMREQALRDASATATDLTPLNDAIAAIHKGAPAGGAGERVAKLLKDQLAKDSSPEALYSFRKMIAAKLSGPNTDDMSAALKEARMDTMKAIKAIDDHLDQGSGKWTGYLSSYSDASKPVNNARAVGKVVDAYGLDRVTQMAGDPLMTASNLGSLTDRFGANPWGGNFTPTTRGQLDDLLGNLRASRIDADLKNAGTGGGSNTQMDTMLAKGIDKVGGGSTLANLLRGVVNLPNAGKERTAKAVSDAAMNPEKVVEAIAAKVKAGQPLSSAEHALWQASGAATAGVLTGPGRE
jgi:hypothetical protein